jgi:tetratricopeptide (TPR) repeat protein
MTALSSEPVTNSRRKRVRVFLLTGLLLVCAGVILRLFSTGAVSRWQAARQSDETLAQSAARPDASYAVVAEWARRLEATSRFEEAERVYSRVMELGPTRVDAWNGFVRAALAAADWSRAEPVNRKAIELWPDNAEARFLLSSICARTFRLNEAIAQLQAGLRVDASNGEAWRTLGDLQMQLKNPREAADAYRKAMRLVPGAKHLRARHGEALGDAGNYDEAVRELNGALTEDPNDMNARFELGKVLVLRAKSADRAQALLELNRVAHFSTSKARAYYFAAQVWFREADYGNAAQALEHAYDENPYNADVLALLEEVYEKNGRRGDAEKIRKALATAQTLAAARATIIGEIQRGGPLVPSLVQLGKTDMNANNPIEAGTAFAAALLMDRGCAEASAGLRQLRTGAK